MTEQRLATFEDDTMTPDLWSAEMAPYVRLAVAEAVARGEVLFDAESYGGIAEANADHAYRIRAALLPLHHGEGQ